MKPETLAAIVAAVALLAQLHNAYMFYQIRVSQLESEKRVLDEVEAKYVRKDAALFNRTSRA